MTGHALDIEALRQRALKLVIAITWLQVPLIACACWVVGTAWAIPVASAFGTAFAVQLIARFDRRREQSRFVSAIGLMASISILVGVMSGQKMQVDLHMYYFAGFSMLVAFCDWRVIATGAAAVALHHLVLNFTLSSLIYPGGADINRVLVHAFVLLLEAAALGWISHMIERMFKAISEEAASSETARQMAEQSNVAAISSAGEAAAANALNEQERARVMREDVVILENLALSLKRLAEGDLTSTMDAVLPKKAETLRLDLNTAVKSLRSVIQAVVQTSTHVRANADEISEAADDLSRRTEQQTTSLQQTTAALGGITAMVRKAAKSADHARQVVGTAKTDAERSGHVVRQAVEAMNGIAKSSGQISQIIGVIDEIAFQTNLLALNAGVEAARAGEAGRGFAVVASEVRALAQRSADAAREIKTLISTSASQVEQGVDLVSQTGQALERIVVEVNEISGIVGDIAASAQEQATEIGEVNKTVDQMDEATRQNAAKVEQTTATSHALVEETKQLARLIARFKVGQGDMEATRVGRPSAKPALVPARRAAALGAA